MNHAKPLIAIVAMTFAAPLLAGHANPWATAGDALVMQYHEENLAQSADATGDDEMRGKMAGTAHGKLDLDAGQETGKGLTQGHSGGGAQGEGAGGKP